VNSAPLQGKQVGQENGKHAETGGRWGQAMFGNEGGVGSGFIINTRREGFKYGGGKKKCEYVVKAWVHW